MDDPTLSGYGDNTTGPGGNVFGTGGGYARRGGYGPGLPPGGWSGGFLGGVGGYQPGLQGPGLQGPGLQGSMLPPGAGAMLPGTQSSPQALSAPLQALLSAHIRRMMSGQGQAPQPPKANFAQMLAAQAQPNGPMGQPQQAVPSPFGQPAQFGGQGPPGGGMRPLTANSPGG